VQSWQALALSPIRAPMLAVRWVLRVHVFVKPRRRDCAMYCVLVTTFGFWSNTLSLYVSEDEAFVAI